MYQLIAAVVAIGLGVITAGAGIYYGGSAYGSATNKAQASQIIASLEQIDAAWSMWEGDGNTTTANTLPTSGNGSTLVTADAQNNTWLQTWPAEPPIADTSWGVSANTGFLVDSSSAVTDGAGHTFTGVYIVLQAPVVATGSTGGLGVCTQVAQQSGMVASNSTLALTTVNTINLSTGGTTIANVAKAMRFYKYGCIKITGTITGIGTGAATDNVLGAAGDANTYLVYYRHT